VRAALILLLLLPGCGACGNKEQERVDAVAVIVDGQDVDAPFDASSDAPADASVDASVVMFEPPCSSTSPSCTTPPVTFLSITQPKWVGNMARVEESLYVSTYDLVNGQVVATEVIEANLVNGTQTSLLTGTTVSHWMSSARGWAYAAETGTPNGSIWRFRPGVAPTQIITGRSLRGAVTADADYLYWAETTSNGTFVVRRLIAGGTIDVVMPCASAWNLAVDDQWVYCATFEHNIFRAPKTGTTATSIAYSTYPIGAMILCGADLFFTNLGQEIVYRVPTPFGPESAFATVASVGRFYSMTASAGHFYTTGNGVYRIDRSTAQYQQIVSTETSESTPIVWKGQLFYFSRDLGVRRCVD
jgi:hypothetical protein